MDRRREKPDPESAAQLERFKEAARALGCDEDEAAFDQKLKAIARQKPKQEPASAQRLRRAAGPAAAKSKVEE